MPATKPRVRKVNLNEDVKITPFGEMASFQLHCQGQDENGKIHNIFLGKGEQTLFKRKFEWIRDIKKFELEAQILFESFKETYKNKQNEIKESKKDKAAQAI